MRRVSVGLLVAALCAASLQADPRRIDPKAYLEHVKFLASEDLEGRGNGSRGLESAAEYIAAKFREAGLEPAGDAGTFFQRFEMTTGMSVEPGNSVTLQSGRSAVRFDVGRDYEIVSTSGNQTSAAETLPVVFAGYGISAPALRYDDYTGIDAAGKAVLVFTHEPQENDPRSAFEGQTNTVHSTMMRKVEVARKNGAKAILVVDDTNHRPATDRFRRWLREPQAEDYGIPVFFLSRDLVQRALGTRLNLETTSAEIDRDFSPKSRLLSDLTVSALDRTTRVRRPVRNVIGTLKGSDPALQSEVDHHRRPLRPSRPERPLLDVAEHDRADSSRRRRQRVRHRRDHRDGKGRRRSAQGVPPQHRVHDLRRRRTRPARLVALRQPSDGAARQDDRDDQSGHGRAGRRPNHGRRSGEFAVGRGRSRPPPSRRARSSFVRCAAGLAPARATTPRSCSGRFRRLISSPASIRTITGQATRGTRSTPRAARASPILPSRLRDSSRTARSVRRSSKRCSRSRIRTRAETSAPCRDTARISDRCPISQTRVRA